MASTIDRVFELSICFFGYVRFSTSDRGQSVENQLHPLQEAAGRLGWSIYRDEGVSGAKGRQGRPGLDALLKGLPGASSTSWPHGASVVSVGQEQRIRRSTSSTSVLPA